jgi:hypothetical protein
VNQFSTSQCALAAPNPSNSLFAGRQTGNEDCGFADLPATQMTVEVVRDVDRLKELVPAWRRLAKVAVEPNIFSEPEFLIPAFQNYADSSIEVVVLTAPARFNPFSGPIVCGIFPIKHFGQTSGLPVKSIGMWEHENLFQTTPLIRKDVLVETWQQFYEWTVSSTKAKSIMIDRLTGDTRMHRTYIDWLKQNDVSHFVKDRHHVASPQNEADVQDVQINEDQRTSNNEFATESLNSESSDVELRTWLEEFFELESKGFNALAKSKTELLTDQQFLTDMASPMLATDKMLIKRLVRENKNTFRGTETVAMNLSLLTHHGTLAFKFACDESVRESSPALMLEFENGQLCLDNPDDTQQKKSNDHVDHAQTNRPRSKQLVESLIISTGSRRADVLVAGLPLVQVMMKLFRRPHFETEFIRTFAIDCWTSLKSLRNRRKSSRGNTIQSVSS